MTPEQIRKQRRVAEVKIEMGKLDLIRLRLICKHPKREEGLYSWRVGVIEPAIICSDCGQCIETLSNHLHKLTAEAKDEVSDTRDDAQ